MSLGIMLFWVGGPRPACIGGGIEDTGGVIEETLFGGGSGIII